MTGESLRMLRGGILGAALAVVALLSAQAQQAKQLATHGKWSAYAMERNGSQLCYMVSKPIKMEGKYKKRGGVLAMLSRWPEPETRNVVQLVAGYLYKEGSDVEVVIDGKTKFTLFTEAEDAWAYDGDDERLVAAMKRGRRMVVTGVSKRGTRTRDSYSLNGFTNAYNEIAEACRHR